MKATLLKLTLIGGLLFSTFNSNAQYYNQERSKLGFLLETNFSNLRYHGFTPSITIGNACHTFQIGPRINYDYFLNPEIERPKFMLDMGYKVVFYNKLRWLELYGVFRFEYAYKISFGQFDYHSVNVNHPGVLDLGEGDFSVSTTNKAHTFNAHLGLGAAINFTDHLYFKTEAALGVGFVSDLSRFHNTETGAHLPPDRRRFYGLGELSWFVSSGIGWRF